MMGPNSIRAFTIALIVIGIILLIVHLLYYVVVFLIQEKKWIKKKSCLKSKAKKKIKRISGNAKIILKSFIILNIINNMDLIK